MNIPVGTIIYLGWKYLERTQTSLWWNHKMFAVLIRTLTSDEFWDLGCKL